MKKKKHIDFGESKHNAMLAAMYQRRNQRELKKTISQQIKLKIQHTKISRMPQKQF